MGQLTTRFEASTVDLFVNNSSTYSKTFTLSFGNTPLDLTGWTLSGHVSEYHVVNPKLQPTVSIILNTPGAILFELSAIQTARLTRPRYVYNIFATRGIEVVKLITGQILVTQ